MKYRALLFDLDDTLYAYAPCNEVGLLAAHARLARECEVDYEAFCSAHDRVRLEIANELRGQAASHNRAIFFKRLVERFKGPGHGGLAVELFDGYWHSFLSAMKPDEAIRTVLADLKRDYRLALVSNHTTDIQLRKLRALKLEEFFRVVVTSEEAGVEKPDPKPFEIALRELNVPAAEALMIGDNPRVDLRGARAAGVPCVLSRQFVEFELGDEPAPLAILDSLGELAAKCLAD